MSADFITWCPRCGRSELRVWQEWDFTEGEITDYESITASIRVECREGWGCGYRHAYRGVLT